MHTWLVADDTLNPGGFKMFILRDVVTGLESPALDLKAALTIQMYMELELQHATELCEVR